ncbi:hypothetical protein M0R45_000187 [Rubus argutus]|uniref:Uncharacterized protein n=1 Tax=Rubus argutus TaxID=59490 RepID=A0AAW1VLJ8_RUBAR
MLSCFPFSFCFLREAPASNSNHHRTQPIHHLNTTTPQPSTTSISNLIVLQSPQMLPQVSAAIKPRPEPSSELLRAPNHLFRSSSSAPPLILAPPVLTAATDITTSSSADVELAPPLLPPSCCTHPSHRSLSLLV